MFVFVRLYGTIILCAILCAIADRFVLKKEKDIVKIGSVYFVEFYVFVSVFRALMGNGREQLSFSFYDKSIQGYIKVFILLIGIYFVNYILRHFISAFCEFRMHVVSGFVFLQTLDTVFIGNYSMYATCFMAVVSLGIAVLTLCVKHFSKVLEPVRDSGQGKRMGLLCMATQIIAFSVQHFISGPTELYSYNSSEFIYDYKTLFGIMFFGAIFTATLLIILIYKTVNDRMCEILTLIIAIYNVMGYFQYFMLNGKMSVIDGSEQKWTEVQLAINTVIWISAAIVMVIIYVKKDNGFRILTWISAYIIIVQLVATGYSIITTDVLNNKTEQIVLDKSLELSKDNNVVVFVLDAYDTQEISMVLSDDSGFLNPLSDFTYYVNTSSRFYYTDLSMPYFLTGGNGNPNITKKSEAYAWYADSIFLQTIYDYGYRINVLTERKYVDKFTPYNPINNYAEDNYCVLDMERTLQSFSKCVRYRNMPLILKKLFEYSMYDLSDNIVDSDIYKFGRDDVFNDMVKNYGIKINDCKGTFDLYHLYGAHAPYFLTQDCRTDYNGSDPMSQFKGSLKVVYNYIDCLKQMGLYNATTIIITADHGLNPGQVEALKAAGVSCDEERSNPIFFIKSKDESHEEMRIEDKEISHDQLFDTIMSSIDPEWDNAYYGTIWN